MSSQLYNQAKPYLAVIFLQFGRAGMNIIAKFALNGGMSQYTFAVYRNVIATVVFAPFALVLEKKVRPRMTFSIFFNIMLLSLLEPVIDQNLYYAGMKLEKVNIRRLHSQAKVVGTLVTLGGAMIMTLIKGLIIGLPWTKYKSYEQSPTSAANQQDSIKGALMITAGCFCWATFHILQAITLKSYPAELSLTSLICMMGALQGTALTLIVEKGNTAIWSIHWDTKLIAALYGGIISSGVTYYVSAVIMRRKGPVFVTAFNPLSMVIVAIIGTFILSEQVYLGRVLGAVFIVMGLYLTLWGKSKDKNSSNSDSEMVAPMDQEKASMGDVKETSYQESVSVSKAKPADEAV
ncbi:hypothetical protein F0562_026121 [Nyssa sinensis]|uniref:WAT1-related protein n=1 Tax=Nyssa sinensis TaxID=561372 RepID=A0A5J5B9X1_9ASTE|nr:hypothetical protein F0562_026121 [Nyssa sinensis]